jgi:hypothetical protein
MDKRCRICLDVEPHDNLFSPCKCNGSVKFVHRECLSTWVKTTPNPDSKRMCMVCHTPYLKSTPRTYALFNTCTAINHNSTIIFCVNLSLATGSTLIVSLLCDRNRRYDGLYYGVGVILFNILFILMELVYGFLILHFYKLNFTGAPNMCRILFSPTFLLFIAVPIITITREITLFITFALLLLFCLNITVSILFVCIDRQIHSTHTSEILPHPVPVVVPEQKETFIEISQEEWGRAELKHGMILNG